MKHIFLFASMVAVFSAQAQKKEPANWQLLDPTVDKVYGTGTEQAYKSLQGKTAKPIIVAVIDGGTDPEHEDLKQVIWTNPNEIPDNGIDDDKNGYIDDIHGWSFLGGKNGDINYEATELARLYHRYKNKYEHADTNSISATEKAEFKEYQKIKNDFEQEDAKQRKQLMSINMVTDFLDKVKKQNNGKITKKALKKYKAENDFEKRIKKGLKVAFTFGLKPEELDDQLNQGKKQISNLVKYNSMNVDSIRQYMVGDDQNNLTERFYGNNHVKGPDALHGSHVAGIIAAVRNNNLGINGVTNDVKIMIVRAVPNGDERDKDVANAIRYAVDNGASVINMSFGKYYSPNKQLVDEAVQYAESKDVLLIHAAGNESKDKDIETSYPSRVLKNGTVASNWIEVGASGYKAGSDLIGNFSNYGKTTVDLFAPGVNIYSTTPDNTYTTESGTSMASPATAGVAALIRTYFPDLKAKEVREVLMKTVVPYTKEVKVPGSPKTKKSFAEMSISGGLINANNAVLYLLKQTK